MVSGFFLEDQKMLLPRNLATLVVMILGILGANLYTVEGSPRRILLDTDVDTDDLFGLLYLLKLNRSEFHVEAVTINANSWANAGHAVNHIYDVLHMMGRDDVSVGVGGEGGILDDGTILPNVGGYLPIIEQGLTTNGGCRYRQAVPVGFKGRLDVDVNFGLRKTFLPQGSRQYSPLRQPTAQQVLIDKVSAGPINILLTGTHTNLAIFLLTHPHLKKNVEHIYVMGGGIRPNDPTSDPGNLYTAEASNPFAEFNFFLDPFAAYQVIHSGIPVTLVPLDATSTIPITREFFSLFEKSQDTFEAQYCFKSLKMVHDTWFVSHFYMYYFMWDSFLAGVATSLMRNPQGLHGENEFAEMEYMNITVVTSSEPYGISDGSNPFFDGREVPKFHLKKGGVHSGHVQRGLRDSFCIVPHRKGKCKDGYTEEVTGAEGVRVLVATKAKPNKDAGSPLDRQFSQSFLDALNSPLQTGRFNLTTQFPCYKEVLYEPIFGSQELGMPVVLDMDMSAGDFLALFYLLKVPVEKINLKAIIVTATGWANAATIDVVYDLLHMMGRDDIPVGLGEVFSTNQSDPTFSIVGDCKYSKAIPQGSGGFLDSDTLYGLARNLPRSPRRYKTENPDNPGVSRITDKPELRQQTALEIWDSVVKSLDPASKITILTNGPLTTLAKILRSSEHAISHIQDVIIVGGHIKHGENDRGNVFTIPSNKFAEFNMFLDPFAAKAVIESELDITLIPLGAQRGVSSFSQVVKILSEGKKTPEAKIALRLLSTLQSLQRSSFRYRHMGTFLGEILGATILAGDHHLLKQVVQVKPIKVTAIGVESKDGEILVHDNGKLVKVIENVDSSAHYDLFSSYLRHPKQSAVIGSFCEQAKMWGRQRT